VAALQVGEVGGGAEEHRADEAPEAAEPAEGAEQAEDADADQDEAGDEAAAVDAVEVEAEGHGEPPWCSPPG
jgi:hypothetical protein